MPFTNDCHVASEKFHLEEISFTDDYHISRKKFQLSLEEKILSIGNLNRWQLSHRQGKIPSRGKFVQWYLRQKKNRIFSSNFIHWHLEQNFIQANKSFLFIWLIDCHANFIYFFPGKRSRSNYATNIILYQILQSIISCLYTFS